MFKEIEKTKILIVEGKDEVSFVGAILNKINIVDIQLVDMEGKENLGKILGAIKLAPGFEAVTSIGIIRDADNNAAAAFDSVADILRLRSLPAPSLPLVAEVKEGLSVTVLILPGDNAAGMLETIVWNSVADHPVAQEVARFITTANELLPVEKEGEQRPDGPDGWRKARNVEKAKIQALLATMMKSVPQMGIAAQKRYFDLGHVSFAKLSDYLRAL